MNNRSEFLKYTPIFFNLGEVQINKIAKSGRHQKYKKNNVILSEGEECKGLFIIAKGKVKVSCYSDEINEVILAILNESDIFGEMSMLDGFPSSATVTAMENSEIFLIEREEILQLLYNNQDFAYSMLQELTKRLRDANVKIKSLVTKDSEGKIATVLIQLADETGRTRHGKVEIEKLPYQNDLANMAGTSRETISRTLHTLAKKGLVELKGSRIRIVDYEKFKEAYI
jgi:CRP/FNR family transcriptional regulator, cyclic AMP receptor protein